MLVRVFQILFLVGVSGFIAFTMDEMAYSQSGPPPVANCDNLCRMKFKTKSCSTGRCTRYMLLDCFACTTNGMIGKGACLNENDYDRTKPTCKESGSRNEIGFPDSCDDLCTCDPGIAYIQADFTDVPFTETFPNYSCQ